MVDVAAWVDARSTPVAYLLALGAGVVSGLAYAPFSLWPLIFIGIATLTLLVRDVRPRRAFGLGYVFGLAFWGFNSAGVHTLGWWIVLVLVAGMALWCGLVALGTHLVMRLPAWPLWVASCWGAIEFAYARVPLGGFGWPRLAFTTPDQPVSGLLPIVGAAGVGWFVALMSACMAWLALNHKRYFPSVAVLIVIFVLMATGAVIKQIPVDDPDGPHVQVGVVQGNVDGSGGARAMGYARSVTNNHFSETVSLMANVRAGIHEQPDFLLWPENSTDIDPHADEATLKRIEESAQIAELPILVGAITLGPGENDRQTTAMWWDPQLGETDRYSKRNLVPFGEYTPMRDLLHMLIPMTQMVGRQSVPGDKPGVLHVDVPNHGELSVAAIICYELAFDSTVYDTVRAGGQVITVQSNNATYTGTLQPHQQFAITRVRAMEMEREIVVSTTSSFSGLIDARGRVLYRTDESTAVSFSVPVAIDDRISLGVRVGPIWDVVAAVLGLGAALFSLTRKPATRAGEAH